MKDTIMEMPDYQRPYEKCLREGEQSLSDRELLAVILRCGVQGLSSLTLADKILNLSEQTGHSGLLDLHQFLHGNMKQSKQATVSGLFR